MGFLNTLKQNLLSGLRIVLPKQLEYKYGITKEPPAFGTQGVSQEFLRKWEDTFAFQQSVYLGLPEESRVKFPEPIREKLEPRVAKEYTPLPAPTYFTAPATEVWRYGREQRRIRKAQREHFKATQPERYAKLAPYMGATLTPGGRKQLVKSEIFTPEEMEMFAEAEVVVAIGGVQFVGKDMTTKLARQILRVKRGATEAQIKQAFGKAVHEPNLRERIIGIAKPTKYYTVGKELKILTEAEKILTAELKGQAIPKVPEITKLLTGRPTAPAKVPITPVAQSQYTPKALVVKDLTPNLKNIKAAPDVKALIVDTAKNYSGQIDAARRGVITHTQTKELADSLNMSVEKLLKRQKGKAYNAEELTAAREILASSANEVSKLSKVARETGADQDLIRFRQALSRHIAIQAEVSGATAEVARSLSAARIEVAPGELTPEFYKKVIETLGGRELTEEMAKRIAMFDPTDFVGMNKFLRSITKATKRDMVFEYWVNSILSNPTTHLVNTVSNFLVRLSAIPLKGTQVGLDFMRATITGTPRERFLGEIAADIYGMTKGFAEGATRALKIFTTGLPPEAITKLEIAQRAALPGIPGEIVRIPGKFLVGEDEFFKALNSQAFLHSESYRIAAKEGLKGKAKVKRMVELLQDPTPEMLSASKAEELYRTFQKELGKSGKAIMKFRNQIPGLKYIMPFVRTPVNILKFGMEMTPLNFLRLGYGKVRGKYPGVEFTDELAKPVIGAVLSATIAYWYSQGKITGHAPVDREERDAFYREGKLPYSIKIGDTWYSYQRLEPIGTVIGLTADFCQDYDKLDEMERNETVKSITASLTQNLINKTYMSGLSNFFNAINDPVRFGGDWLEMFTAGFIPQFMTVPTTINDPYYRRAEGVVEAWKKKIPGLSETVPPVRNVWGEKAIKEGGWLWRAISPIKKALAKKDLVDIELKSLNYEMGFPSKTITGNFKLDAQHYDIYQRATGRKIHQTLETAMASPEYQELSDEEKVKVIRTIVDSTRDRFRKEMTFTLFVDQMDIDIPPAVSQETAAMVYYVLARQDKFKKASNDEKRELYTRNLHKYITY